MNDPNHGGRKLLLTYNIKPSVQQEYFQFMIGRYVPIVQAMGLEMLHAFHTEYGDHPNRLIVFVARDSVMMDALLVNKTWLDLNVQLDEYVTDFSYKVVPYKEAFQF